MPWVILNSICVYVGFCLMLAFGLSIDSTYYANKIAAGNLLWLPMYLATYSMPNWIGVSILATYIGKMSKDTATPMGEMWRQSIFSGLMVASVVIFGGSYLDTAQVLTPTRDDYFKIVSVIILAGIGQREIQTFMAKGGG